MKISDKIANKMLIVKTKNNPYSSYIFFASSDVSKSVVTVIRFTVGDHVIIKCS